ncbi:MAG: ankyrin repeat domain-containing protein [Bacteroidetes bacterium]|jgi:hypothetical protein|nr:ankyrin repeat domain-containing protein [Bacteroidota bacterium]
MASVTSSSADVTDRKIAFTFDRIVALVLAVAFLVIGGRSLVKSLSTTNATPPTSVMSASSARQALVKAMNYYGVTLGPNSRRLLADYLNTNPNVNEFVSGESLLSIATECGYTDIVEELINRGANPNLRGAGWPSLYTACQEDKYMIALLLIKDRANVNESKGDGWTPLLAAASSSKTPDLIKTLIAAGANVNAIAPSGESSLDLALRRTDPEGKIIAGLIQAAGGRTHKYQARR